MDIGKERIKIGTKVFERYLRREAIKTRVHELGRELEVDYHEKNPLFIIVLNGAFVFAADLLRSCGFPLELEFVKLSSYASMQSTGEVKRLLGLTTNIEGRHVIIVEDIVDTGLTIGAISDDLRDQDPASVQVVTLLLKPDCLTCNFESPYVGFEIPPAFVVGYGLDIDNQARYFPDIYQLVAR